VSVPFVSLRDLLTCHAERSPDAPAILAPGRTPLSYGRLLAHVDDVGRALRAAGIDCRGRVAVAMPNGPELTTAIVAVAANAACASMNPAYGDEEFGRYFDELRPGALIAQASVDSPARRAAVARGIRVLELSAAPAAPAGVFTLTGGERVKPSADPLSCGDVALLLFTSGTTSRPKIVPLTHVNVCTSAHNSATALALSAADRCVNVLPLFHGHGLIATVMATLTAGASVVCTPGCDVNSFFGWLNEFRPTWYSAVPTMHQAILAKARNEGRQTSECRLRLVRSASAPLPPPVFAELERLFDTCVIEFYGMTETASSPIACNPLPPGKRKAGSVGRPAGLDVEIVDDDGQPVPGGETGQVVVRGAAVTPGYDGDAAATRAAFDGDWFRTGDHGFFDNDGYLFLVGRRQEIINRGGEKIAPREVDDVLLEHPAVAEAVTFAVPHATLGEDVASVIVLRPRAEATARDIRQFALGRVADFKVPRQVLIVGEIPKSSTGKVQRVGLAAKLGLADGIASRNFVAPRSAIEQALAGYWAELLKLDRVGVHDDFFALGGDSLQATCVLAHVYEVAKVEVDPSCFFEAPTIADTAHLIETSIRTGAARSSSAAIVRVPRDESLPASFGQDRLLQLQAALTDLPFFNILYALRLTSPVDVAVLERGINEIVRRHDVLRTTFAVVDGAYMQVVAPQLDVPLVFDDLRKLRKARRNSAARKLVQDELLESFDVMRGPLIRTRMMRLAEQEYLLLITLHEVIVDGWSLGVLVEELAAVYDAFCAGKSSPLAPLAIQYADFAHWQRHWRSHADIAAQLDYWREQLHDPLPVMTFPPRHSSRPVDGLRTAQREIELPARLVEAVKRFSRAEGGTLFMALVAALKAVLHGAVGEDDLRVATLVANRNRPGTSGLMGPLVNTLILRTSLDGDPSARDVFHRVRATILAAFAHQDLPFEELADTLEREREIDPAGLAQVMIWLQNAALRPIENNGRALAFEEADPSMLLPLVSVTTFDITLMLRETPEGLVGKCVYKPDLFAAKTIDRLLRDFQKVLDYMVRQSDQPISKMPVSFSERVPIP
jgi:acyl-CoA synthetase (AMP-forming)/AMP-acid ligase II